MTETLETIGNDYAAGVTVDEMCSRYGIHHRTLKNLAKKHGWHRPKKDPVVPVGVQEAYESGVALDVICARFGIGRKRLDTSAKRWTRPERVLANHEDVRREYEGTTKTAAELAEQFGYTVKTIKSMAASGGWRRNTDDLSDDQPRTDPLGDRLAAMGFMRHTAPAQRPITRAPTWVR